MKFVMIAELLLILFSNGIRFYAVKRYIDFFAAREKCLWKYNWILYTFACIGTYIVSIIFESPNLNIISNVIALFLLACPYKIKLSKKFLMTFIIYSINLLADIIVVQLLAGYVPGQRVGSAYQFITSLAILIPTAFFSEFTKKKTQDSLPLMNVFILGMIPLVSIVCMHSIATLTENNKPVVLTVAFSLILINSFLFYLYYTLTQFYVAKMNEKKLEQIIDVYAHQLDVMQESQEHIKKLRHDMKHHLIELSAMAQQDKNKDMMRYLEHMEKFMLNPAEKVSTGNKEIDGVLNYMLRRADELLKIVNLDIQIPKSLYRNNFNICVILGNLVDNAVRESSKSDEKYLSISVRVQKDILIILIENSYSGSIVQKGNIFQTSQIDTSIHGLGLESVKQVVEACGGDIKIEYTEKRFWVQVLLYLSNIVEN